MFANLCCRPLTFMGARNAAYREAESVRLRPLEISAFFSVEPMMYFGLGFLAASLIAMAIYPAAVNRAVRLTTRRVMAAMPSSLTEALADKDTVRAMFAMSVSKLEKRTEQLIERMASQGAQLG